MAVCSPAKEKRGFNATCAVACAGRAMQPPPIISIAGEYAGFKTTLRRTAMQDATPGNGKKISRKKLQLMQTSRSVDRLSRAMPVPITTVERGSSTTKMGSDVSSRSS